MVDYKIEIQQSNSCLSHYNVEYKRSDEREFNTLSPNPQTDIIIIPSLLPGDYDIRIVGVCCNGAQTNMLSLTASI